MYHTFNSISKTESHRDVLFSRFISVHCLCTYTHTHIHSFTKSTHVRVSAWSKKFFYRRFESDMVYVNIAIPPRRTSAVWWAPIVDYKKLEDDKKRILIENKSVEEGIEISSVKVFVFDVPQLLTENVTKRGRGKSEDNNFDAHTSSFLSMQISCANSYECGKASNAFWNFCSHSCLV